MNNLKYLKFVFYLAVGLALFLKTLSFIDPDFGWHLATGNLILKFGFPKTDPFSYTMPSYPVIAYEWLVDVIFAKIFPILGMPGISALFSALFLSAILISVSKSKKLNIPLFIIGVSSIIPFFSNSPKIFSWLLFSVFYFIVLNETFWKKYWLLFPLITVLWTNLHGSFPLALVILLVVLVCKSFREKHIWLKGFLVTILSFLATLINPYGINIWWVVWNTVFDTSIKYRIAEWQPTYLNFFAFSFLAIFLFTISLIFIPKFWRKFRAEEIILILIFFVQALFAVRMIPYWVLVALPMTATAIEYFYGKYIKGITGKKRFLVLSKAMLFFMVIVFSSQLLGFAFLYSNYNNESYFYPKGAILFLKENLPKGQIFSEYNWGGYLNWKLPEKKIFISGMMPVWKWQAGLPNETNDAMADYLDVMNSKAPYGPVFNKYNIDTALLSNQRSRPPVIIFAEKAASLLGIASGIKVKSPLYEELNKDGWIPVYQDSTSVVFKKPL